MSKDTIKSLYDVGDTLKVINPNSPYLDMSGSVVRIGTAGWRTSYHMQFPNVVTIRDVGESEVELVEKSDPVMSPNVEKEPVRVNEAVDDTPRVIIPAPSVPAVSDVEVDSTPDTITAAAAPKRRGRPPGSKNKPKSTTTTVKSTRKIK